MLKRITRWMLENVDLLIALVIFVLALMLLAAAVGLSDPLLILLML